MTGIYLEDDPERVVRIGDRYTRDFIATIPEAWIHRIAQGYMCLNCFQPYTEAYPIICSFPGCNFAVRRCQRAEFERAFRGRVEQMIPSLPEE